MDGKLNADFIRTGRGTNDLIETFIERRYQGTDSRWVRPTSFPHRNKSAAAGFWKRQGSSMENVYEWN